MNVGAIKLDEILKSWMHCTDIMGLWLINSICFTNLKSNGTVIQF